MARRMRQAVTQNAWMKVEGMPDILRNIEKTISRTTGTRLEDEALVAGAKPIWSQAKQRVQALNLPPKLKQVLDAEVSIVKPRRPEPYVIVGTSQGAGVQKLGSLAGSWRGRRFVLNPYWIEFGVAGTKRNGGRFAGRGGEEQDVRGAYSRAQPFFRPAITTARPLVKAAIATALKKIVEDVGK